MRKYLFPSPEAGELEQVATNALLLNDYWLGIVEGLLTPLTYEWRWQELTNEIETGAVNAMTPVSALPFYGAKIYRTNNFAIAQNTNVQVAFESIEHDTADCFDNAHPERLTAPLDGFYEVKASVSFAVSAVGRRRIRLLYQDGVAAAVVVGDNNVAGTSGGNTVTQVTLDLFMYQGDWIEITASQDTAAPLNVIGGRSQTWMSLALRGILAT